MGEEYATYLSYYKLIESLVFWCGLWHHYENKFSLYKLIIIYGLITCNIIGVKVFYFAMSNIGNVSVCVKALQNTVAIYAPMSRMVFYLWHRKEFVFLDKELGAKFNEELKNAENRPVLLKHVSLYRKFMYFFNVSITFVILMYWAPYAVLNFKYKKSIQVMPGKYPFPVPPRSPFYWAIFAFETSSLWYTYYALTGVDNAFGVHCFRMRGLIRLAAQRFRDLNPEDPRSKDRLKECVETHQLIIRAKEAVQTAYGVIVIFTYLSSAVVMCSVMWQFDQVKRQMTVPKLIFFVAYMVLKLVQTFIYAYYGSAITADSEDYQDAIYSSNWQGSGNVRLMKDFVLVMSQRTVSLKACGFFYVDMQFFEKICSTTISYFFLIQTLDSK